jgi:hypothetical protein
MLALLSRKRSGSGSGGEEISLTTHLLEIVLAAAVASLFILTVARNLCTGRYPELKWKNQIEDNELPAGASASKYAHIPPGQPFVVTGARTGFPDTTHQRPLQRSLRLEISELERSGPASDLYLQCQNEVMARNQEDVLSYYKIADMEDSTSVVFGC